MDTLMLMTKNTDEILKERTGKNILEIYEIEGYKRYAVSYKSRK